MGWLTRSSMFSFCNHAEQLQHQRSFQPFLLWDSQGQPWPVVSQKRWDVRSAWLWMAKWQLSLAHIFYLSFSLPLSWSLFLLLLHINVRQCVYLWGCTRVHAIEGTRKGCCCWWVHENVVLFEAVTLHCRVLVRTYCKYVKRYGRVKSLKSVLWIVL